MHCKCGQEEDRYAVLSGRPGKVHVQEGGPHDFERQEGGCWQRIPFVHRPVPMKRDCQGILRGQVTVEAG